MVNPDDHDRILVDPAYRLWKTSYAESKFRVVTDVMNQIDAYVTANSVVLKSPVAKVTYENSVEAEKAWAILER